MVRINMVYVSNMLKNYVFALMAILFVGTSYGSVKSFGDIEGRRCTGAVNCTACTTCSGCRYCKKEGGTCGVCSSSTRRQGKSTSNFNSSSSSGYTTKKKDRGYYLKTLVVTSNMLNVRSGPGTHYTTTDKLYKGDLLVFLSMQGEWVKVENKRTKQIGYVFFKYVAVID